MPSAALKTAAARFLVKKKLWPLEWTGNTSGPESNDNVGEKLMFGFKRRRAFERFAGICQLGKRCKLVFKDGLEPAMKSQRPQLRNLFAENPARAEQMHLSAPLGFILIIQNIL